MMFPRKAAEKIADALYMSLTLGEGGTVRGQMEVPIYIDQNLSIPIGLEVVCAYQGQTAKSDAGIMVKGPGDLAIFIGIERGATVAKGYHFAIIDASQVKLGLSSYFKGCGVGANTRAILNTLSHATRAKFYRQRLSPEWEQV